MKNARQSNLELLRIIAILAVVTGHFIRQSTLGESPVECNTVINTFLGSGARIAVNIFLLIGSWFMVDQAFRPSKALKLYLETAFYCIPITLLMICMGTAGGTRNVIQGMLPFFGRPVWFATAYISLILLSPFLNMAFQLPQAKQKNLIGLLFILYCVVSTVPSFSPLDYIADFSWFCVVYLAIGWFKKNEIANKIKISKWMVLILSILLYVGLCSISLIPSLNFVSNYWLDNIKTFPNVLCAFGLFFFFLKTKIGTLLPINFLARSVFAVYVVHQVPAFRKYLWNTLCFADSIVKLPPLLYVSAILAVSVVLLLSVTFFDLIRIKLFSVIEKKLKKGLSK